jgi:hypothetical protein
MSNLGLNARLKLLAKVLCVTPTDKVFLERDWKTNVWWLRGCVEGDTALPQTKGSKTIFEALENVEGWLAPEYDEISDEDI